MDLQDPLRLRLMSHLQCYSAQRELSLKSSATHTGWNPSAFTTPTYPTLSSTHSTGMSSLSSLSGESVPLHGTAAVSSHYTPNGPHFQSLVDGSSSSSLSGPQMMSAPKSNGSPPPISSSICYPTSSASSMAPMSSTNAYNPYFSNGYMSGSSFSGANSSGFMSQQQNSSVKHYRPWGAELVY